MKKNNKYIKAFKPNQAYIITIPEGENVMDNAINSISQKQAERQDEVTDLDQLKQRLNNGKKHSFKKR